MTRFLSYRLINLYIFLFCVSLLGIALYMEHVLFLEPCPLCITQRIFFLLAGLASLAAFLHNPVAGRRIGYGIGAAVLSLAGARPAMRQLRMQGLAQPQVPAS